MPQALVDTSSESFTVKPLTADLGVNPGWKASSDAALEVPAYNGVEQITQMALMFTLWASVEPYLYGECELNPLQNRKAEQRDLGILRESETSVLCLLCLLNNEPYSAGRLVDAMIGEAATADQRGNARKRLINRTLPVVADRYGLLQYQTINQGNLKEYRITRTVRLAQFAERHLAAGVRHITGSDVTAGEEC